MRWGVLVLVLVLARSVAADEVEQTPQDRAVEALLPTLAPLHGRSGLLTLSGGYDAIEDRPTFASEAELVLADRIGLRAGFGGPEGDARPLAMLQLDVLSERSHGLDLAFASGYEGRGFNGVPSIVTRVGLARTFGGMRWLATTSFGAGLEESERFGELSLASLRSIGRRARLGVEVHGAIDLERDADEPEREPDWQLRVGPTGAIALDSFLVGASAGLATTRYRLTSDQQSGVVATMTVGKAF